MNLNPLGNRTRHGLRYQQLGRRVLHDQVLALTRREGFGRHSPLALNIGCSWTATEADLYEALSGR